MGLQKERKTAVSWFRYWLFIILPATETLADALPGYGLSYSSYSVLRQPTPIVTSLLSSATNAAAHRITSTS